ncbi:MAG TPA: ribosome maturation factor RimM [Acidimicrobiia bacterium]|nr:ribosome maturation factor RimM [Acidimicrobiia bacterium]
MTGDQDHIPIGYVRKAHGIRGDVLVRGLVSDAAERFTDASILITGEPQRRTFAIEAVAPHQGDFILSLEGIVTRNDAEALVGTQFVIPLSDRRRLDEGEWWIEDLVGCVVVDRDETTIGTVTDVIVGAAQDRLAVTTANGSIGEVPFVDQLVPIVDIAARRIVVDLPEGLIEPLPSEPGD